ncbi:protein SON isoform X2 [Nematostella vectensis]|uniref:protein SON isoform X2 n=1 Tax=Nematostella vectensis TaxID=45351 RepID=UPI002076DAC8|nr:protein SON isoform X2 [Nematostella vectensis]
MDAVEDNAGKYSEKEKKLNNYESSVESVSPERSERRGKSSKKHKHKHSKSKKKHKKRRHRSRTRSKSREKGDTYAEGTLDESVVEGPLLPSVEVSHEKNEQKSQPNSPVDNDNSESKRRSRSRSFSWPPRERNSKSKSKSRSKSPVNTINGSLESKVQSNEKDTDEKLSSKLLKCLKDKHKSRSRSNSKDKAQDTEKDRKSSRSPSTDKRKSRSRSRSRSRSHRKSRKRSESRSRSRSPKKSRSARRSRSPQKSRSPQRSRSPRSSKRYRSSRSHRKHRSHSRSRSPRSKRSRSPRKRRRSKSRSPRRYRDSSSCRRRRSRSRSRSPKSRLRSRSRSPYRIRYRSRSRPPRGRRSQSPRRRRTRSRSRRRCRSKSSSIASSPDKSKDEDMSKYMLDASDKPVAGAKPTVDVIGTTPKVMGGTGKSIAELTAFCKRLTEARGIETDNSPSSAGQDKDTEEPTISHPFLVRDKPDIVIPPVLFPARHIVPTVDPTKPLTEQFPVSCGTKHHEKEDEVTIETAVKGVDAIAEMAPKVFEPPPQEKVDVSNLVVKRIEAQRRLQADPNDIEAMLLEQEVSLKMQSWAQSNVKPGQFTGHAAKSTLSKQEIHSGYQAWAKKDMFHNLTPVSGGIGMKLLQKMGWQPGQAIGRTGEGNVEPIALTVKTDRKGLSSGGEKPGNKKPGNRPITDLQVQCYGTVPSLPTVPSNSISVAS